MEISDDSDDRDLRARAFDIDDASERGQPNAAEQAATLLNEPGADETVVALCERVLALDRVRAGRTDEARSHIARALAAAERVDDEIRGRVHLTAMSVAASTGRTTEALGHADAAAPLLTGERRIRLDIQRASVLHAASRTGEAYRAFRAVLAEHPDLDGFAGGILHLNTGSVAVRLGRLEEGVEHLRVARYTFESLGDSDHAAACAIHAARAAARAGDFTSVFEIHAEVDDSPSVFTSHNLGDLADCLIAAGLLEEAEARLRQALRMLGGSISELSVRTELSLGRLLRRRGDVDALAVLDGVRRHAREIDDRTLEALATIDLAALNTDPLDDRTLIDAIAACRDVGLDDEALDGEIVALQRRASGSVGAAPTFDPPPIAGSDLRRAQAHHHRALAALCRGDGGAVRAAAARGLRAIDRSRAAIAADELRAVATDRSPALAELGVRSAVESGRAAVAFEWAERSRAAALRLTEAGPNSDPALGADLSALRSLTPGSPEAIEVERRVTDRRRTIRAHRRDRTIARAAEVRSRLADDQVLLEYVDVDGRLFLIEMRRHRTTMRRLDVDTAAVSDDVGKLLFGLRRMASTTGPSVAGAVAMVEAMVHRLAVLLVPTHVDEPNVILVPTGPLHQLPWAALPSLADRAVAVTPSAHAWHRASARPTGTGEILIATGPGLPHADDEARTVAAGWNVDHLSTATSGQLAERLATTDVLHVCCHGRFRADNPQFSSIDLADGPFMVVDLDRVERLPTLIVLSACNVGALDVRIGDDVLGFPAALLARGVRTLVAASIPVEDRAASELAVALHRGLVDGLTPSRALSDARRTVRDRSPAHAAAAAAMSCFGAG